MKVLTCLTGTDTSIKCIYIYYFYEIWGIIYNIDQILTAIKLYIHAIYMKYAFQYVCTHYLFTPVHMSID